MLCRGPKAGVCCAEAPRRVCTCDRLQVLGKLLAEWKVESTQFCPELHGPLEGWMEGSFWLYNILLAEEQD